MPSDPSGRRRSRHSGRDRYLGGRTIGARTARALLLAAVCGALSGAAFGEEVWSAPSALFATDQWLILPIVLTDSAGGVHVFFTGLIGDRDSQSHAMMYMQRSEDGRWSKPVAVMQPQSDRPLMAAAVALDEHGCLQVVYSGPAGGQIEHRRVHLSQVTDPDAWSRPTQLSAGGGFRCAIAVSPYGKVHVLYANRKHQVFYHRSDDGGRTWSKAIQVSAADPTQQGCEGPRLAVDSRGRLHAVWLQAHLPNGWPPAGVFYSRSLDTGETWSPPRQLAGDNYTEINVAALGTDEVHVAWNAIAGVGDRLHQWSRDGGETWSAPRHISDRIRGGVTGLPGLAFDSSGMLHLVTSVDGPQSIERIFHLIWNGSAWSEPQLISAGTNAVDDVENPALAIGRGANVYVVYQSDFQRLWFTEHRSAAPPLPPRPVPPGATDVLSRLRAATPKLRIFLIVIALLELGRRLVRRTSR